MRDRPKGNGGAHRFRAGSRTAVLLGLIAAAFLAGSVPAGPAFAAGAPGASSVAGGTSRTVLLGLRTRGNIARFARRSANPSSPHYRHFLTTASFRKRFSASRRDRTQVARFLRRQRGISSLQWNSTRTTLLAITTSGAARRNFCARGPSVPAKGLCLPRPLRGIVRQISVGEAYGQGGGSAAAKRPRRAGAAATNNGTPAGCKAARATGAYLPNQLATAYGVDALRSRGLAGQGIRVDTLSSQPVGNPGLGTWARCVGLPKPQVEGFSMPSASRYTAVPSNETTLDIEALASLAPRLQRITPIFVPLDVNFSHSFSLFMFGALDRSAQGGRLPHLLSISDGVCEPLFSSDQLQLGQRLLREASALGITALSASGDAGFLGCEGSGSAANFPNSSRWVTGVGGTDLGLVPSNRISDQTVWSTFATAGPEAVGTGGGPSGDFGRPGFQRAPGIGPELQSGKPTRLTPDLAAMASFTPGIATYNKQQQGWGADGGTSAATPLTAAMVALGLQQELGSGRGRLGSLPPLLYQLARGSDYGSIFFDVTAGTSSRKPSTSVGMSPAGGAAQPGYDLATGLGSLDATAFADALATAGPPRR